MASGKKLPQFVLFGASLTQWAFDERTRGFGWVLENKYQGKAEIVNEGKAGYTSTSIKPDFNRIIVDSASSVAPRIRLFTIFLGANDACFNYVGGPAMVPIDEYERNLRHFVETILTEDHLSDTKIVLITPPPWNIPVALPVPSNPNPTKAETDALEAAEKEKRNYQTYMNKKKYGDKVMELASFYESTGRVAGFNLWKALIDAALKDQGRLGDEDAYDENRLPGSRLPRAMGFRNGYFTDGLHLDALGYDVLSQGLLDLVSQRWPELTPERIHELD